MTRSERLIATRYARIIVALGEIAEAGERISDDSNAARDALDEIAVSAAAWRDWLNGERDPFTRNDGSYVPKPKTYAAGVARALAVDSITLAGRVHRKGAR